MTDFITIIAADKRYEKYLSPFMDADEGQIRCLILHQDIDAMIALEDGSLDGRRRVAINEQLTAFVAGDVLTVIGAPFPSGTRSKKPSEVRGLQKHEFVLWELKFRKPTAYRLIGIVPAKDTFVGMRLVPREGVDWNQLGSTVLTDYKSMLGKSPCTAAKTYEPDNAFSRWRSPK